GMALALGTLALVERLRDRTAADTDLGGHVEHPHQPAAVAPGPVQVAADPARVPGHGASPETPASRSALANSAMSPPVVAMNSAPSRVPMPGRLVITAACSCSRNRPSMAALVSASSARGRSP